MVYKILFKVLILNTNKESEEKNELYYENKGLK